MSFHQAQVGWNHIADTQVHDVAGDDVGHVDLDRLPVAIDEGEMANLRVQRLDRLLGAVLVQKAQPDAHHHDRRR